MLSVPAPRHSSVQGEVPWFTASAAEEGGLRRTHGHPTHRRAASDSADPGVTQRRLAAPAAAESDFCSSPPPRSRRAPLAHYLGTVCLPAAAAAEPSPAAAAAQWFSGARSDMTSHDDITESGAQPVFSQLRSALPPSPSSRSSQSPRPLSALLPSSGRAEEAASPQNAQSVCGIVFNARVIIIIIITMFINRMNMAKRWIISMYNIKKNETIIEEWCRSTECLNQGTTSH